MTKRVRFTTFIVYTVSRLSNAAMLNGFHRVEKRYGTAHQCLVFGKLNRLDLRLDLYTVVQFFITFN